MRRTYLPAGLAGDARPVGVRGLEFEFDVPFNFLVVVDDVAFLPDNGVLLVGIREGVASSENTYSR